MGGEGGALLFQINADNESAQANDDVTVQNNGVTGTVIAFIRLATQSTLAKPLVAIGNAVLSLHGINVTALMGTSSGDIQKFRRIPRLEHSGLK